MIDVTIKDNNSDHLATLSDGDEAELSRREALAK